MPAGIVKHTTPIKALVSSDPTAEETICLSTSAVVLRALMNSCGASGYGSMNNQAGRSLVSLKRSTSLCYSASCVSYYSRLCSWTRALNCRGAAAVRLSNSGCANSPKRISLPYAFG